MDKSALIAMSGGVDSSVAAWLMLSDGYRVEGTTMRLYDWDKKRCRRPRTCCTDKDMNDASEVAVRLGIPYEVTDYRKEFKKEVIDRFIRVYEEGGTPNPCIDCNRYMKFDILRDYAEKKGLSYLVTGHYARIEFSSERGRYLLKKAVDLNKDQSYVLYNLTQEQLAHTVFPLGSLTKDEVRRIAAEQGFYNAKKKDSQDICFVPDGDYASFIEWSLGRTYPEGDYIDRTGKVIGTHHGAIRYTIGQRKGLGMGFGKPMYVYEKSMKDNTVTLADEKAVFQDTLYATDLNWIAVGTPGEPFRATAKHRYLAKEAPCTIYPESDDEVRVVFDESQRAMTRGQAVVFYEGDIVIGGGTIDRVMKTESV